MANSSFFKNTGTSSQLQGSASASAAAALASEQAALASQTAAATSETNAAASAAAALVSKNAAASSAASSASDASASAASAVTSQTAATSASANAALTSADATQTAADRVQTGLDRIATAADAVQTAADRVQTGLDVTSTGASAAAALSSRNAAATSETNASASATAAAADAVSTAADAASTAADAASTAADALATAADRVQTGLDATSASNSAAAANTSASAASASQVSAAASAASAAATLDTFDDRYLGSYASDPTVDNDGDPLVAGALYFSNTANEMRVYDGSSWIAASSAGGASLLNYNFTATAAQTAFSGADDNSNTLGYTVDNLIVTRNGVVLEDGTDYTATDGSTITLAAAAVAGDEINVVAFKSFTTADMVSATNGGTFQGNVDFAAGIDVTGNVTVTGTVDGRDVAADGTKLDGIEAGADVTDTANVTAAGALMTTGGSVTGDVSFGDNDKAIFGAGSDLQIYHDGSHSYIKDAGTGQLRILATDLRINNTANDKSYITGTDGAEVSLYHNGSGKLATTATGVDVTGGLTTTDNVGIGTSSPADKLEIHKAVTGAYSGGVIDGGLRIDTGYSAATGSYGHNGITFYGDADNASFIYQIHNNNSTSQLAIGTNNTERMRIDSSGNAFMKTANSYIAGTTSLGFYGDAASSNGMFIDSSGNVGIGTTSPSATLEVNGGTYNVPFAAISTDSYSYIAMMDHTTTGSVGNAPVAVGALGDNMIFRTSQAEKMRIDSSGNVLLGCTSLPSPSVGGAGFEDATQDRMILKMASTTTGGTNLALIYNPNGNIGSITTSGSSTSFNTSSDYRLKENVVADWDATTRLKQLNPVRFNFIVDPDTTVDGFLAHEVQTVVPEAIIGTKDAMRDEEYEVTPAVLDEDGNEVTPAVMGTRSVPDYQGIDQSKLVPLLVKTIQELEARITALETA